MRYDSSTSTLVFDACVFIDCYRCYSWPWDVDTLKNNEPLGNVAPINKIAEDMKNKCRFDV